MSMMNWVVIPGMPTFEVVTARRTFSLTADSMLQMEEWVKAIQNALCRNATVQLLSSQSGNVKPVIQGWCTKVSRLIKFPKIVKGSRRFFFSLFIEADFLFYDLYRWNTVAAEIAGVCYSNGRYCTSEVRPTRRR